MSENKGATFANNVLGMLTGDSLPVPLGNSVFIALGAGVPTATFTGFNELSVGGYARKEYMCGAGYWSSPTNREVHNTQIIEFNTATANWPLCTSFAVYDQTGDAEPIVYGTLDLARAIGINDRVYFPAGSIVISETNSTTRKSAILANSILKIFRLEAPEALSSVWLALGTKLPDATGEITELTGKNYKRVEITCNDTNFVVANRKVTNQTEVLFDASSDDWEPIKSWALYKSENGGSSDLLWYGAMDSNKVVYKDDKLVIPVAALEIEE